MTDSTEERPSLFNFSHIESLSYPSSYETSMSSTLSLFNLDLSEGSAATDYAFAQIPTFNHPHQIRIPQTPSSAYPQDEGYVTPDCEADDPSDEPSPTLTIAPSDPEPIYSWEALLGCDDREKPLLSSYGDADSVEKMMWMTRGDKTKWYPNDPVVIQLHDFVHDLRYLLAGIPSRSFQFNEDANTFIVMPNIKLPAISTECMCAFAEEFITCGNAVRYLDCLSLNVTRVRHGLVYNTLCQTLSVYLQCMRSMIFHMDLSSRSLTSVAYATATIRSQLIAMSRICRGFDADTPPIGGNIIDRLFTELDSTATSEGATLVYSVLRPCLVIYFKFLFKWIFQGEIDDPYQEFFIDKKFPYIISNSRHFWTRGFICVDKLLPAFLSDLKEDILACGKTMCLLKICDPNNPIFRLMDECSVAMDVCDSYESLEELRQGMKAYYKQCQDKLGIRVGFKLSKNCKSEKLLQEEARLAREKNMADYQAKRRKKLQEIADKKYKQLLELKQQISDLKLRKEEEEQLRLETERKWLEQVKKEQELDMILEQTKQAKIGEFYKSLLEESQKRVALTVWKIKRSKLAEKRTNYFLEAVESDKISLEKPSVDKQSDSCQKTEVPLEEVDMPSSEPNTTAIAANQNAETDDLIRSFIEQLDSEDTNSETINKHETLPKFVETNIGSSLNLEQNDRNLAETSTKFSQNNLNFRAWLDDKDQALRNRVKVLSSGLSDILTDTDVAKKLGADNLIYSNCEKKINSFSKDLTQKCDVAIDFSENLSNTDSSCRSKFKSDKSFKTKKNISQPCTSENDNNKSSSPKKDGNQFSISHSNINKPCDNIVTNTSFNIDKLPCPISNNENSLSKVDDQSFPTSRNITKFDSSKNITDKSLDPTSGIDKSPFLRSCTDWSSSPNSDIGGSSSSKSNSCRTINTKSQTDESDGFEKDTDKPPNSEIHCDKSETLSELEDARFFNLNCLPLKTDIIDAVFTESAQILNQTHPCDLTWISSLCVESARIPLRIHTLIANYLLMKHFVDAKLIGHLHLIKSHFLLHNPGFRATFVHGLGQSLREYRGLDARQVDWNGVLVEGLLQAKAEDVDPAMYLVLGIENAPSVLDITDPEVFSCFTLQYSVEWPLNLIMTPDAISRYNKIFKFLLKVMYVDWILMNQFQTLKDKKKKHSAQFKKICLFRHGMTQFIHPLACFISESIIQAEFDRLLRELEKDCHIDSVYYKHVDFVKSLMYNCFLTVKSERIALAFKMIFKNVLQFNEALVQGMWRLDRETEQLVHSNFDRLELCFRNFITLATDVCEFLRKSTDSGYQVKLNNLTAQLSFNLQS